MEIISKIEEITEPNIKYATCDSLQARWFQIDLDKEGYCIYGYVSGSMPTSVCNGSMVKYWKTWKGVISAIRKFAQKGNWGFQNYFPYLRKE